MKIQEEKTSEAYAIAEWEDSEVMKPFSIDNLDEKREKSKKEFEAWQKEYKQWYANRKKVNKASNADLYSDGDPPFPGSNVSVSDMADYLASGEYYEKPYDSEKLLELIELSGPLKDNLNAFTRHTVGLDIDYEPRTGLELHEFNEEQMKTYRKQGKMLLAWANSKAPLGRRYCSIAKQHMWGKKGLGTGYWEIIRNAEGAVKTINYISDVYLFVRKNGDGYVWIKNGKKKYFKKYGDDRYVDYRSGKIEETLEIKYRANELIPFMEYNDLSSYYGVPQWTAHIPAILGNRYAEEHNANFFNNSATPRLLIIVAGGKVDSETKNAAKKFFRYGKGRENAHRTLLFCVSGKNSLAGGNSVPQVTVEPLGVGKTDDASFLKYQQANKEGIREAFQQALTFLGQAGDTNRASAYTLRDQTVTNVYTPEAADHAYLFNETLLNDFAEENKINDEDLLVQLKYVTPRTMSEKDFLTHKLDELRAGAVTINDYRVSIGLDKINRWWAELCKPLLVPAVQLSELAPDLVQSLTSGDEYGSGELPEEDLNKSLQSMLAMRRAIYNIFTKNVDEIRDRHMKVFDDLMQQEALEEQARELGNAEGN